MRYSTFACLIAAAAQVPFVWRGSVPNALALGFVVGLLVTDVARRPVHAATGLAERYRKLQAAYERAINGLEAYGATATKLRKALFDIRAAAPHGSPAHALATAALTQPEAGAK